MKKLLIVNNNMKVGGVQKSLSNLLWSLDPAKYEVTLLLFAKDGAYLDDLPDHVCVKEVQGPFRYLGKSQGEHKHNRKDMLIRGFLAALSRLCGRRVAVGWMLWFQPRLKGHYDCAVSFLHNGRREAFYGGVQDYVLRCVDADRKVAFLHGDYGSCGANHPANNRMMARFDAVAACSDGCHQAFLKALPHLGERCLTVRNCHRYDEIVELALENPPAYAAGAVHAVLVARLTHEKGVERAITAVAHTVHSGVSVHLHIVGDGPLLGDLQQQVVQEGLTDVVHFHGEQANPYPYIQQADLLLVSSYHEAAPMVIDEARCLGVPVLSTKTISAKEMVTEAQAGWVCDNSQEALNEALCRVARDREALTAVREHLMQNRATNESALEQFDKFII